MGQAAEAFRIHRDGDGVRATLEPFEPGDPAAGEVVIRVEYSSVNYKDGLAATGQGAILRRFPLIGGIDLAGRVAASGDRRFTAGDAVLACGAGLSETLDGGYTTLARLPADAVVPLPDGLDSRAAMALGTAGLTAALAIDRFEQAGLAPAAGPVVVTGATGGVGSLACDMLAKLGYEVVALTGRARHSGYLERIGAARVLERDALLAGGRKPLDRAEFAAAIDSLGGDCLDRLLAKTRPGGLVASVGLAASAELHTTVLPLILRGVSLLGINSVELAPALRTRIWSRLGTDMKPRHLDTIVTREIGLADLPDYFAAWPAPEQLGRTVVRIAPSAAA